MLVAQPPPTHLSRARYVSKLMKELQPEVRVAEPQTAGWRLRGAHAGVLELTLRFLTLRDTAFRVKLNCKLSRFCAPATHNWRLTAGELRLWHGDVALSLAGR